LIVEIQAPTRVYESKVRVALVDGTDLSPEQGEIFGPPVSNRTGKAPQRSFPV
jgi:hypothetical protein